MNVQISYQGHKWSLSAFLKHLKANNIDTVQLMQSIEDVIIKVFVIFKKKYLFNILSIPKIL